MKPERLRERIATREKELCKLQSDETSCFNQQNELLVTRENELHNSLKRFTFVCFVIVENPHVPSGLSYTTDHYSPKFVSDSQSI